MDNVNAAISEKAFDIVMYDMFVHYDLRMGFSFNREFHFAYETLIFDKERIKDYYDSISTFQINAIWRKAFRRKIWENIIFDEVSKQVQISEDLYFTLNLMEHASNIKYISKALYYYRCNFNSMTHIFQVNRLFDKLRVYEFFLRNIQNKNLDVSKLRSNVYQYVASSVFQYIATMASNSCRLGVLEREEIYKRMAKEPLISNLLDENGKILNSQQADIIKDICSGNYSSAEMLIKKNKLRYLIREMCANLILK